MKKITFLLPLLFLIASCATVFDGRKQQIAFDSNEKDVKIYVNDRFICKTPCIGEVKRKKNTIMIRAQKQGFENRTLFIDGTINSTSLLNVISLWTSTFGFTSDMSSGSIWMYQPNAVYVTMTKEPRTAAEKAVYQKQNKVRDFVLRNFSQLQNDLYSENASQEYIQALAQLSGISVLEIRTALQSSYAGPDTAEKIIGLMLSNSQK